MIVVDASTTLSWFFEDERSPSVIAVVNEVTRSGAIVPAIWPLEVANAFRMAIRRKRIDPDFRGRALAQLGNMPISLDVETNEHAWDATVRLSDLHGLTVYDAAYLELAIRRKLPLATLDDQLKAAATQAGVTAL